LQSVSASQTSPDFDCPADLLNPFRFRYSKKGLLDAADDVALARNRLFNTMKQEVLPQLPTLRKGLAAEDRPEVGKALGAGLEKAHDAALGLYCQLQKQSRIAMASATPAVPLYQRIIDDLAVLQTFVQDCGNMQGFLKAVERFSETIDTYGHGARPTNTELENFFSRVKPFSLAERELLVRGTEDVGRALANKMYPDGRPLVDDALLSRAKKAASRVREVVRVLPSGPAQGLTIEQLTGQRETFLRMKKPELEMLQLDEDFRDADLSGGDVATEVEKVGAEQKKYVSTYKKLEKELRKGKPVPKDYVPQSIALKKKITVLAEHVSEALKKAFGSSESPEDTAARKTKCVKLKTKKEFKKLKRKDKELCDPVQPSLLAARAYLKIRDQLDKSLAEGKRIGAIPLEQADLNTEEPVKHPKIFEELGLVPGGPAKLGEAGGGATAGTAGGELATGTVSAGGAVAQPGTATPEGVQAPAGGPATSPGGAAGKPTHGSIAGGLALDAGLMMMGLPPT